MKILVPLERVADPDNANRIRISADGSAIDTSGLEFKCNPFDEYALETALRLTEDGRSPKQRAGEVIAVSVGGAEVEPVPLRSALATGASRAVRVDPGAVALDGWVVALALEALVRSEAPDLVLLGKQAVDGDTNQVGQILAERLGWPAACFAATVVESSDGTLVVGREVDGGVQSLRLTLPAVITVDLRVVAPGSVRSRMTPVDFLYPEGVRFAPLPAIMQAKKKPLAVVGLHDVAAGAAPMVNYQRFERPAQRGGGVRVGSVAELVERLVEARVIGGGS